jgi:hypothetical protein
MSSDFQIDVNFVPEDLIPWYHDDSVPPVLVLIVRNCPVQISRCSREHVQWWPAGGRGWTEPLEKTLKRLHMFQETSRITSKPTPYDHNMNGAAHTVSS